MSTVLPFRPKAVAESDTALPTASGEAVCMSCRHEWAAVAPVGTHQLECPQCHTHKGHWKFEFQPEPGTLVRACHCQNQLFYITPEGHICANCGIYQRY